MTSPRGVPSDPEFIRNTSTLIGYMVLNFALFEFGLNSIIASIFHRMSGETVEPEIPVQLNRCLGFIRRAATRLPRLSPFKVEMLEIVDEAKRLATIRHDIVHGYIAEYDEQANHLLTFAKSTADRQSKTIHKITLLKITAEKLAKAGSDSVQLSSRTAILGQRLLYVVMAKHERKKHFRRVGRKLVIRRKAPKK